MYGTVGMRSLYNLSGHIMMHALTTECLFGMILSLSTKRHGRYPDLLESWSQGER